jgi:hypothetical protein
LITNSKPEMTLEANRVAANDAGMLIATIS